MINFGSLDAAAGIKRANGAKYRTLPATYSEDWKKWRIIKWKVGAIGSFFLLTFV